MTSEYFSVIVRQYKSLIESGHPYHEGPSYLFNEICRIDEESDNPILDDVMVHDVMTCRHSGWFSKIRDEKFSKKRMMHYFCHIKLK